MKNIKISDKVPHLAEVLKDFEVGVLHPSKILKHPSKGTIIKWEIEQLDAGEERIMTYSVQTKLSILGNIKVQGAIAKFDTEAGKTRAYKSNKNLIRS